MADELLASPLDFPADARMTTDWDKVPYPKTPEEAKERWRQRVQCDLLGTKAEKTKLTDIKHFKMPEVKMPEETESVRGSGRKAICRARRRIKRRS